MKRLFKRSTTFFLAVLMLFSVCGEGLTSFAAPTKEDDANRLPVQDLQEMDYIAGMPYVGIASVRSDLEETGTYLLTVRRTGDISLSSTVELRTVDVSAGYGRDYVIDDPRWDTEVFPQSETLVQQYGNEANRLAAAQTLSEIEQRLTQSAEDASGREGDGMVTTEPTSELARLKMEQSGLPVRQTTEDSGDMLPPELQSLLMEVSDIAEILDASSVTTLSFAPWENEVTVRFSVLEDDEKEGDEIINFLLAYPDDNSVMIESARSTTAVIKDDEPVEHSVVSFTHPSYSAGTEKVTLVLERQGAEYSYATVSLRSADGTAVGGLNYEPLDITVSFAQFQTTATVDIPVAPALEQTDFSVELYDFMGIEAGETVTARVTIPGNAEADGNALLMDDSSTINVFVGGQMRTCSIGYFYEGGWAPITCTIDGRTVEVGKYRAANELGYNYVQIGKGSPTYGIFDGHLRLYLKNSNFSSKGSVGASFRVFSDQEPSRYYASMYLDYETFSNSEGSEFSIYGRGGRNKSFVHGKHQRTIGLGITIPDFDYGHPGYADEYCDLFVAKTKSEIRHPDAFIYGYVLLYQAFDVNVVNPNELLYASGKLDADGKPIMEKRLPATTSLAPGSRTRVYSRETITISEYSPENNNCIYGELIGYNITPSGGSTFFYQTNSRSIRLDRYLIELINNNSGNVDAPFETSQGQGFRNFVTSIEIRPVYQYKDVVVELDAPTFNKKVYSGQITYTDKNLQDAWAKGGIVSIANVYHVGDRLNPALTPANEGVYFEGYWRKGYKNPGDTKPELDDYVLAASAPTTTLTYARQIIRPVVSDMENFIHIELVGKAKDYFEVSGLVPADDLTKTYMTGKNVLNTGTADAPETLPVVGQAYSVLLTATEANTGVWRPKFTIDQTGVMVNGYSFDFIAADNPVGNTIKVTAEKIKPDKLQYYAIKGAAVYQSYSLRASSASLVGIPTVDANVTAGGESVNLYHNVIDNGVIVDHVLAQTNLRQYGVTDSDGRFTVAGIRALAGDTISVLIDNKGVRQVAYVQLNADHKENMMVKTIAPLSDGSGNEETESDQIVIVQTLPVTAMPIITNYSPYVTGVSYDYSIEKTDNNSNEIPIKGGQNNLLLTVDVNLNGDKASDFEVIVFKIDSVGNQSKSKGVVKDAGSDRGRAEVSFSGTALHDGDEFWVQLKKTDGDTFPMLKTGLVCYTPIGNAVEQRFTYTVPTPYDGLPIVGTMSGTLDSGVCNWQTIYLDKNNPGSSPYAQLITMAFTFGQEINMGDLMGKKALLDKLKSPDAVTTETVATQTEAQVNNGTPVQDVIETLENQSQGGMTPTTPTAEQTPSAGQTAPGATGQTPSAGQTASEEQSASLADRIKKYTSTLDGDALGKLKEPKITFKMEFLLQLEYDYDPVTATHFYSGGQYLISGVFGVSSTIYWSVLGVPMYVNIQGTASVQFDGVYAQKKERMKAQEMGYIKNLAAAVPTAWPYFQLTFRLTAQPGIGVYGVFGVRGVVSFAILMRANWHGSLGGTYGVFSGGLGVDLGLFSFTKTWPVNLWKSGVFSSKSGAKNGTLMSDILEGAPVSIRAFDAGEERAQNTLLRSTLTPQTKTTLIDGAMEYVRPQLVDLGDGRTMLLFLRKTDDDGRDQNNTATLVYAIRNADGTWENDDNGNIASAVIENDGYADSVPTAYRVDDKVYIAWTNAEIVGSDSFENANQSLQNTQIHLASYDIPSGAMSDAYAVTDDCFVNSYAHLIERQGYIVLYYFKRDIAEAQGIEDLASLSSNYNTWALRIFDPATGSFVGEEELLYVKHPTVADPLVFNLEAGQYTYTDSKSITKKYGIISYIADADGDLNTAEDRELWAIVRNQTDGKAYYPIKLDSGKASIAEARLTEQNGELYLTWLTDGATLNTLRASEIWESLDSVFGSEDGSGDVTALELIRSLSEEQIKNYHWNQLPYLVQPADTRDGEFYAVLADLAYERFPVTRQQLIESASASSDSLIRTLSNHRVVAGADGNLYYFWTEPSADGMGQELYGTAFYTDTSDGEEGRMIWSKPVQLTDYGLAIDELTIEVNADNGATMIANLFELFLDDEEGVAYGPHKLTEIGFVPGSSLVIAERAITLSDEYPIPGETVTASFEVANLGLLPADSFLLTLDGESDTKDQTVLPGESVTLTAEKIAGDGTLSFSAKVQELDDAQLLTLKNGDADTASVTAKSGWALNFGSPEIITYNEAADQVGPLLRELMEQSGREWNDKELLSRVAASVDPKYMAILNTLNCAPEQRQKADLYVVVPVTNVGNQPAEDISFIATEMHEELSDAGEEEIITYAEGDKVGAWTLDAAPVKTLNGDSVETKTVYVAIPLADFNVMEDMNSLGRVEITLEVEKDGMVINNTLQATRQITRNVLLQVNGGAEELRVRAGESKTLNVLEHPFDALKNLSYEIEDSTVAAVTQEGTVTGLKAGTTLLTVKDVSQPRLTAQLELTVTESAPEDTPAVTVKPYTAPAATFSSGEGSVSLAVGITGGTAAVAQPTGAQLAEITAMAGETGSVTVDLSGLPESVTAVSIPAETVKAIREAAASGGEGLTFRLPGSSVTFDAAALASVAEQAAEDRLTLRVEPISESGLNERQKAALSGLDALAIYNIYLSSGDRRITDFGGGLAAVTVAHDLGADRQPGGVVVWHLAEDGEKTMLQTSATAQDTTFTAPHFSNYALAYDSTLPGTCAKDETCPLTSFTDLDAAAWYHDGIHWALDQGIMNGVGNGKFAPSAALSRAMIVTMLWRMAGEPVVNYAMRFEDVPSDVWFTEAVRWAASEGIVEGYSAERFGPNDPATREQLAAILYRCAKRNGQGFTGTWAFPLTFDDASDVSAWATEAMCWMIMQGVIQGTGNNMLTPKGKATRAQAATMLMRYAAIP